MRGQPLAAIATAAAVLVGAFAVGARPSIAQPPPKPRATTGRALTAFVASSMADAIGQIAREYERDFPGASVRMNVAGSQQLVAQLEQKQQADVLVSADEAWMKRAEALGRISGRPAAFATNRPVVIVSRTHGQVRSLLDLARPGSKLVLGAPAVPIGRYSRQVLEKLSKLPGFPANYQARVLANVVSQEENVKGVASKVQLGEADAGIVYISDVTPSLAATVRVLELPAAATVRTECWIAVLRGPHEPAAREFVARVRSDHGGRVLTTRGFTPLPR